MKLSELRKNNLARINAIDIKDRALKIHLMEMGLVNNTQVKVIRYSKNKEIITIYFRNYELSLSKDILDNIVVVV